MSLMVSGTHNLAYGSLIVLQLPLHLFIVILYGLKIGSLVLTLIISDLISRS